MNLEDAKIIAYPWKYGTYSKKERCAMGALDLGLIVEYDYFPGSSMRVVPGPWEKPGEPYMEYNAPEITEIKYYIEFMDGTRIEMEEKHLSDFVRTSIEEKILEDIEEQELLDGEDML